MILFTFDFDLLVTLDDVADADVVERLDVQTAVLTDSDLLDIVLEPLERPELAGVDDDTVADDADGRGPLELALADHTPGDGADLGNLENLQDLDRGDDLFLHDGLKHTLDSVLDVVDGVVDDGVKADFDLLLLGDAPCSGRRTHLEPDDDGVGCGGEQDVGFGNLTHGGVDDIDLHRLLGELDERPGHGLDRTVDIALDDDVQFLERTDGDAASDFVERDVLLGHDALHALQLLALVGDFARRTVVVHDVERIARLRSAVETQHLHGRGGPGDGDFLAVLVEHGLDAPGVGTREHDVADAERTALDEDGGDVAAPLVERRLDDRADGFLVGVGLEVEHLGF